MKLAWPLVGVALVPAAAGLALREPEPEPPVRRSIAEDEVPPFGQWAWIESRDMYVAHPPREVIRTLLGDDVVDVCDAWFDQGYWSCTTDGGCFGVRMTMTGNSQMNIPGAADCELQPPERIRIAGHDDKTRGALDLRRDPETGAWTVFQKLPPPP
ncbi:MAG: hypothetical protein H6739_36045 [Alphaproteobacteria bacterium]|nr:hypothetical protein [Alphaproteobacteria bacterium]